MGWVDQLHGEIVALDTAPLIYFIEEHPDFLPIVAPFFEALDRGDLEVVTSTITLLEVLVHPLRESNHEALQNYRDVLINAQGMTLVDVSADIAVMASSLRASYGINTPDAIQIATAIQNGAAAFLTNDRALKQVAEIQVLIVQELQSQTS
jgi:predicted nucleic acid-binding protein